MTVIFVTHRCSKAPDLSSRVAVMSARPGRVTAEIALAPSARNESWRLTPGFASAAGRISAALKEAA